MVKNVSEIQSADVAINAVLGAERAAKAEIEECRRKALAILREARARNRSIMARADRRINRIHELADAAVDRTLEGISADARKLSGAPSMTPALAERLETAIEQLIGELLD
jgi:vacuolar-type H+-ATPase subunit H